MQTIAIGQSGHPAIEMAAAEKQGCQIFLRSNIPKWKKYIHQMTTNYTKLP
jgi:hypothetical protein